MHVKTLDGLSYSDALTYAKLRNGGIRIAREGWNGKGMYVVYFSPVANGLETLTVLDNEEGTTLPLRPFLLMKDATNCYVPWLASQTDMIDNDWCVFEDEATKPVEEPHDLVEDQHGEDNTSSYDVFKSFNRIMDLIIKGSTPSKIMISKIPSGQNEKFKKIAEDIEKIAKNGSKDEEDLDLYNMPLATSKEGKNILQDFLFRNIFDEINDKLSKFIREYEDELKLAEQRKAELKLYKGQNLFNTFYCTLPEIYSPKKDDENVQKLTLEIYRLAAEANAKGYRFIRLMDGSGYELEETDNQLKITRIE